MGWRKTVASENKKTYRQALDVVIGIDASTQAIWPPTIPSSSTVSTWYDGHVYEDNWKYTQICKKAPILMDFANGGFYNDGKAEPITSDTFTDETGYGIIAASVSTEYVETKIEIEDETESGDYLTVCARDSKGKLYYTTIDLEGGVTAYWQDIYKINFTSFPDEERLYILWIAYGSAWMFDNSNLIDCTLNLRGVETKIDNPELQMSEIELNAYSKSRKLKRIPTGTPIMYSAGYSGDMSTVRTFYTNDKVTQDKYGKVTITGYDATMFLEGDWDGDKHLYYGNCSFRGMCTSLKSAIATQFSDNIKSGPYYPSQTGWTSKMRYAGSNPSGIDDTGYMMLDSETTIREHIARYVNIARSLDGGYMNTAFFANYVDAGHPIFITRSYNTDTSVYADTDTNFGTEDHQIRPSQMTDLSKNFDTGFKTLKITSYRGYQGNVQTYKTKIKASSNNVYRWFKFDNPVVGIYTFNTDGTDVNLYNKTQGGSVSEQRLRKARMCVYKYTDDGVASSFYINITELDWDSEPGTPFTASGSGTGTIELPDLYVNTYVDQDDDGDPASMLKAAIKYNADRSLVTYVFTFRGDPKMQPRDIISISPDGTGSSDDAYITLTVDSLTLEHSGGGFTSKITAREGWV